MAGRLRTAASAAAGAWLVCSAVAWAQEVDPGGDVAARAEQAATAEEPVDVEAPAAESEAPPDPDEVIYVDEQAVIRARQELGFALRDMGYQRKRVRNGREIYVNEIPWKPQVVVDDDGWMVVRRAPPSVGKPDLPGIWSGPLGYLVCVANPTACVHIGGWVISERKLAWHKHAVVEHTEPTMGVYEDALIARAFLQRTGEEIPEALIAVWERGQPIEGEGTLESHAERRAAVLEFWITRTCSDWGQAARQVTEDFIRYEIQESAHPFTAAELAEVNARRTCQEPLIFDGTDD
jgi:hypothetical protein